MSAPNELLLANLNGLNEFSIRPYLSRQSGISVSDAGDLNGDGFGDVIIGTPSGNPHVVFGSDGAFPLHLVGSDLNGTNGFVLQGTRDDLSGISVSSAGDVNGDGLDDLVIGAPRADSEGKNDSGEAFVVFGSRDEFDPVLELADLDGTDGFRLVGARAEEESGRSVSSAGDVNGDGFDDIVIGVPYAEHSEGGEAGGGYVVFGKASGFPSVFALGDLNGSNGFRIDGEGGGWLGFSVSSAGDVNGDGFDDLIIGAPQSALNETEAGSTLVIYGAETGFRQAVALGTIHDDWVPLPSNLQDGLFWVDGGEGTDMMTFAGLDAGVTVDLGSGRAMSQTSATPFDLIMQRIENVTGTSHDDSFSGSERSEIFRGLGGRDLFNGAHAGADLYEGGGAIDTITYQTSSSGVSASLLRGRGWVGDAAGDRYRSVENLIGSQHDDFLWGDHRNNRIEGLAGDDVIEGRGGNDYILAGHGTDTIAYFGNQAEYTIIRDGIRTEVIDSVAGRDGHDVIGNAEILRFADGDLLL